MHIEYQKTLKEANELFDMVRDDKLASKLPPCQQEKAKVKYTSYAFFIWVKYVSSLYISWNLQVHIWD